MTIKRFHRLVREIEAEQYLKGDRYLPSGVCRCRHASLDGSPHIHTLEGNMSVVDGDWVIRGIRGEYYPCKPDIFKELYTEIIEE